MNTRKLTYTGKSVYIGIDVHKKSYTFSAYCDGIICKTATVPANPESFAQNLNRMRACFVNQSEYELGVVA